MNIRIKNMPLSKALDMYLDKISFFKKGYKQEQYRINTIKKYRISNILTNGISTVDVAEYRDQRLKTIQSNGKTISSNTVRLELSLLSHLFNIGIVEWGIARTNPVLLVRKPKVSDGRNRRLQPAEYKKLIKVASDYSDGECVAIINLALETAMRQGEILSLRWEYIDLRNGVAHLPVTKNGESRDVPLSSKARMVFSELKKNDETVFSYTSNGFKSAWRKILIKSEIKDLHFHDLRHESISRFVELGTLNLMEISAISGHKSLNMLKRYTHLSAKNLTKKIDKKESKKHSQYIGDLFKIYPAAIELNERGMKLTFVDFEELFSYGEKLDDLLETAQHLLLRELCILLNNGGYIPQPSTIRDEYVMINPIA